MDYKNREHCSDMTKWKSGRNLTGVRDMIWITRDVRMKLRGQT